MWSKIPWEDFPWDFSLIYFHNIMANSHNSFYALKDLFLQKKYMYNWMSFRRHLEEEDAFLFLSWTSQNYSYFYTPENCLQNSGWLFIKTSFLPQSLRRFGLRFPALHFFFFALYLPPPPPVFKIILQQYAVWIKSLI